MQNDLPEIKPKAPLLSTKLTPSALGLVMIDGLPPHEQAARLTLAAIRLFKISHEVRS